MNIETTQKTGITDEDIQDYLTSNGLNWIRRHFLGGVTSILYDKNGKGYEMKNKLTTLDDMKSIVEKIKKIGES